MPYKRKQKGSKSRFWWVSFTDANGKRIRVSTGTTQKREAVALEAKWKAEKPMNDWKDTMNESDSSMIPRSLEDVLDMVGTTDLAEQTLDKYNSKKALRATKP